VADIAVLYPIAALQADYYFATPVRLGGRRGGQADFYYALEGGVVRPENDYMDLGELLFRGLRVDYTYLHPEVLVEKGLIQNGRITLDNRVNREEFRVLMMPGGNTIPVAVARKILDFYRSGGTVVATRLLPTRSAEFGQDAEVRRIMDEIFGVSERNPMTAEIRAFTDEFKTYFANTNEAGGRGYFLPQPDPPMVSAVLKDAVPVPDVAIDAPPMWPVKMNHDYNGALTYIHKVKDNRDIYFFSNSQDAAVDTNVVLRGNKNIAIWNPHTGQREQPEVTHAEVEGQPTTTVRLKLDPVKAVFFVTEGP
jgi:hypothetical protein